MKRFISFITSLRNIKRPQLILGGLLVTTTVITTLIASPAYAFTLSPAAAAAGILTNLFLSVGELIQWASVLFLSLIINVILPGQNSLIFGEQVFTAWRTMLDLTNIVFFLALFIFAIFIITRNAGYNFKKAVIALITAIALANLSLVIVQLLIEMGDALRNFSSLIPAFGMQGGDTTQLREWLHGLVLPKDFNLEAASKDVWDIVWVAFQVMAAQAIIAYVLFRLMFVLVERAIRLAILAIFGPIQAAISVLPQKELQGLGSNWFGDVLRWVLVLPLSFILIGIARLIMPTKSAATLESFLNQAQKDGGTLTGTEELFLLIIGLGVLVAASSVPTMLKVPVSALTNMLPNYVGKAGKDLGKAVGKGIWNNVKARGKHMAFKVGRNIPGYRWVAGKIADRKREVDAQAKQRASFADKAARDRAVSRYNKNNQRLEGNIKIQLEQEPGAKQHGGFDAWLAADPTAAKAAKNRIKDRAEKSDLGLAVDADNKAYMAAIMDEVESESKKDRNAGEQKDAINELIEKIKSNPNDNDAKMKLSAMLILLKRETNRTGAGRKDAIEAFDDVIEKNSLEDKEKRSKLGIHNKVNLNPVGKSKKTSGVDDAEKDINHMAKVQVELKGLEELKEAFKNGLSLPNKLMDFQMTNFKDSKKQERVDAILDSPHATQEEKAGVVAKTLEIGRELAQAIVGANLRGDDLGRMSDQNALGTSLEDFLKTTVDGRIQSKRSELNNIRETVATKSAAQPGMKVIKDTVASLDPSDISELSNNLKELGDIISLVLAQGHSDTAVNELPQINQDQIGELINKIENGLKLPGGTLSNNGENALNRLNQTSIGIYKILRDQSGTYTDLRDAI